MFTLGVIRAADLGPGLTRVQPGLIVLFTLAQQIRAKTNPHRPTFANWYIELGSYVMKLYQCIIMTGEGNNKRQWFVMKYIVQNMYDSVPKVMESWAEFGIGQYSFQSIPG